MKIIKHSNAFVVAFFQTFLIFEFGNTKINKQCMVCTTWSWIFFKIVPFWKTPTQKMKINSLFCFWRVEYV